MERYGGAGKSAECHGTGSTLFCAPTHCRRRGSFTSGEAERLETGVLLKRGGCGEAANPDLWGGGWATAASTRPFLGYARNSLNMLKRLDKSPDDLQDLTVEFI